MLTKHLHLIVKEAMFTVFFFISNRLTLYTYVLESPPLQPSKNKGVNTNKNVKY